MYAPLSIDMKTFLWCREQTLSLVLDKAPLSVLSSGKKYCISLVVTSFLDETSEASNYELEKRVSLHRCQFLHAPDLIRHRLGLNDNPGAGHDCAPGGHLSSALCAYSMTVFSLHVLSMHGDLT